MANAFIVLLILAVIHFVYSGILLPSIRLSLRLRLFALRDELRHLKIAHEIALSDEVFRYVQESLNNTINLLPRIDLPTIYLANREIQDHRQLTLKISHRINLIDGCPVSNVKDIYVKMMKTFRLALIANSVPWFIYLVPLMAGVALYQKMAKAFQTIVSVPESQINAVLPYDPVATM